MSHLSPRWCSLVTLLALLVGPLSVRAQVQTDNPYAAPAASANAGTRPAPEAPAEGDSDGDSTQDAADDSAGPNVEAADAAAAAAGPGSETVAGDSPVHGPTSDQDAGGAASPVDEFEVADHDDGVDDAGEAPRQATTDPARPGVVPAAEAARMAERPVSPQNVSFHPGHGLHIQSDDGAFSLDTRLRVQVLYQVRNPDAADEDAQQQLTLRRARIQFGGHFFGEDNRYKMQLALSPRDEGISDSLAGRSPHHTPLLDYYLEFRQLRDLRVRLGQFKVPFNRERVNSSGNLQLVGRSIVNEQFNLDRDLGIDLSSQDLFGLGHLRYHAGVYIDRGREAVGFGSFHMFGLVRLEYLPFGSFHDMSQTDFERSADPRLAIGAAFGYIDHARNNRGIKGHQPADGGTTQTRHLALDAIFKLSGFSAIAELLYRSGHRNPGSAVDDMGAPIPVEAASNGYGVTVQAGYLLPRAPFEVAARYSTIQRIGSATMSSLSEENELALGLNWYFAQHPFKLQADVVQHWGSSFGNDGEMLFELQLQGSI